MFPQAHILVTVREQDALILSGYGHFVRGGGTASLADFLARPEGDDAKVWRSLLQYENFDFDALIDLHETHFGAGRVTVLPLEWMTRQDEGLRHRLAERVGLDLAPSRRPIATPGSTSPPAPAATSPRAISIASRRRRAGGGAR